MRLGPDIAPLAAMLGDPARANMLTALMSGKALTAGELAKEAGVLPQTASSHLAKMREMGLLIGRKQGRHRYYALRDHEVAEMLEGLMSLAAGGGGTRTRTGPKEPALRDARTCYDHLAGAQAVAMLDGLIARGAMRNEDDSPALTENGIALFEGFGIDIAALRAGRRPVCRACLDWSERRFHLGGALGAAVLTRILELGWATREDGSRAVRFTNSGLAQFREMFVLESGR